MIQNLIFGIIIFLKIFFRANKDVIFVHMFQWTLFFNFRLFSRKSQSQQTLEKKFTNFIIQFRSKYLTYFINLYSLDIENKMLPEHSQKYNSQILQQICFCLVSEKTFALNCFLKPNTAFLKHFESKCLYICILLYISVRHFLFQRRINILSDGSGLGKG